MKNPFKLVDDSIMYCANKAVRGWNYVTGKGKASLANILAITSSGSLPLYAWSQYSDNNDLPMVVLAPFFSCIISVGTSLYNNYIEKEERELAKKGLKDRENDKFYSIRGYSFMGLAASADLLIDKPMSGLAPMIFSASDFVMRADNELPHKKNVLSRAVDKIKESRMVPAKVPVNYSLEERV